MIIDKHQEYLHTVLNLCLNYRYLQQLTRSRTVYCITRCEKIIEHTGTPVNIKRLLHDIFHICPGISPRLPYQARQRSWRADMGRGLIPVFFFFFCIVLVAHLFSFLFRAVSHFQCSLCHWIASSILSNVYILHEDMYLQNLNRLVLHVQKRTKKKV
jgi:hypothetical protein